MDPVFHEPAIAFYVCSDQANSAETGCRTTVDELRVTQRNNASGRWNQTVVDQGGGYAPKLGFFTPAPLTSKRFLVYRTPSAIDPTTQQIVATAGALKLAVER
jgi:hypothetical protein